MDRLAAHVIATAALTVTLATVPVLFADATHAAAASHPQSQSQSQSAQNPDGPATGLLPALPPLPGPAQTRSVPYAYGLGGSAGPGDRYRHEGRSPLGGRVVLPNSRCTDARQVGPTEHAYYRGAIAFSVEQYYSQACHAFYGYSFAWEQFRRLGVRYDVGVAVYDESRGAIDGPRVYLDGQHGPGYWSAQVPAADDMCTSGESHYFYYPADAPSGFVEDDVMTPKACA